MRQKTQQGLGPGPENPFESDEDGVPPGERITPVDSERGRSLARAAQAAILEAERELDAEREQKDERTSREMRRTFPEQLPGGGPDETREFGSPSAEDDARKEFDTVPGGGLNRESGGRAIARAYVSPKTPMRLKEGRLALISVDVDPEATSDSRSFPTEKALRAGSLVPPPTIRAEKRPSKSRMVFPFLVALASAAVITTTIVVVGERESVPVPVVSSSVVARVVEAPPSVKVPVPDPVVVAPPAKTPEPSAVPPAGPSKIEETEKSTPGSTKVRNVESVRPTPKSKPAAPPPKKASGQEDVWLE